MIKELVKKNRSIRRFKEHESIPIQILRELIDLARLSPSAANKQPLKYIISCEPEIRKRRLSGSRLVRVHLPKSGEFLRVRRSLAGAGQRPARWRAGRSKAA